MYGVLKAAVYSDLINCKQNLDHKYLTLQQMLYQCLIFFFFFLTTQKHKIDFSLPTAFDVTAHASAGQSLEGQSSFRLSFSCSYSNQYHGSYGSSDWLKIGVPTTKCQLAKMATGNTLQLFMHKTSKLGMFIREKKKRFLLFIC